MSEFKEYFKKHGQPLRPVTQDDIDQWDPAISVSAADKENGSPKIGDMIAVNPSNMDDRWLVGESFFKKNYAIDEGTFLERLVKERGDLDYKTQKLSAFVYSDNLRIVSQPQKILLKVQLDLMKAYLKVLSERIDLLTS